MESRLHSTGGLAVVIAVIALLALTSLTPKVLATTPVEASGAMNLVSSELTGFRVTDEGDTIINIRNSWNFQGTFIGTFVTDVTATIHVDGPVTVNERGTFTGTVAGAFGTVEFRNTGTGEGGIFELQGVLMSGTQDLAALRGQGTFEVNAPLGTGTYLWQIHFD